MFSEKRAAIATVILSAITACSRRGSGAGDVEHSEFSPLTFDDAKRATVSQAVRFNMNKSIQDGQYILDFNNFESPVFSAESMVRTGDGFGRLRRISKQVKSSETFVATPGAETYNEFKIIGN